MKIRTLFAICFLAGSTHLVAQDVSPTVIATAGGSGTVNGVTVMWTVGEVAVLTLEGAEGYVTQGFHQPPSELSSAPYETAPTASVDVWPNPTANTLLVSLGEGMKGIESVELLDMVGRPVLAVQGEPGVSQVRLDVTSVPSGTYMVRLQTGTEQHSRVVTIRK